MKVFNGVIYSYQSPSGKFYIGQTTREEKRKWEHKNNAENANRVIYSRRQTPWTE